MDRKKMCIRDSLKINIIYIQIRKVESDYKKILSIILVMVFMITFNNNVYAAELDNMQHNDQAYVLSLIHISLYSLPGTRYWLL